MGDTTAWVTVSGAAVEAVLVGLAQLVTHVVELTEVLYGIFHEVDSPLMHFVSETTELRGRQVVLSFKFIPAL